MNEPDTTKAQKENLRTEALRARGLLPQLTSAEVTGFCQLFFDTLKIEASDIIAGYCPKGRELDIWPILDALQERGITCALPVVEAGSRVLKFALWHDGIDLVSGAYRINHPVIDETTKWLEPDIIIVPMLAFDRRGYRLGFGGGFYDATLEYYRARKDVLAVGAAYAQQACLFNLPIEAHDIRMDLIITPEQAFSFKGQE